MHHAWLTSHVQLCLQDVWGRRRVQQDHDGDFPYRCDTAVGYVRVEHTRVPRVRVFAIAATGVPRSAKLLTELNDVNASTRTAHVYWHGGTVFAETALLAVHADRASLRHACRAVGSVATRIGPLIAAVYGGSVPCPVDDEDDGYDGAEAAELHQSEDEAE